MPANVRHQTLSPACQNLVAGQAEDKVGIPISQDQGHQFRIGEVAVAAQQDMGCGPVPTQQVEHPLHDHGVLGAAGGFARTQHGGDEGARVGLEHQQGQVTMVAVMVVVEGQRLLAVGGVVGMVHVQRDAARGVFIPGDELLDQGAGQAVDVAAPQRAFQAGVGGAAGQRRVGIQRRPSRRQFEQRVMAQGVGIVAVFVAGGHLKDALRQQVAQRMGDIARIARIPDRLGQALDEADTRIHRTQYQGAQVRGNLSAGEVGADREARGRRKSELSRGRICHWASAGSHFLRTGF